MGRQIEPKQIKAIWASAREYGLDRQSVYDVIASVSGQEHMTKLSYAEAAKVLGMIRGVPVEGNGQKRTDEGGNPETVHLRRKIYRLTGELGWNDDVRRINGFCRKLCGVEQIEWLTVPQCHRIIEALKNMVKNEQNEAQ